MPALAAAATQRINSRLLTRLAHGLKRHMASAYFTRLCARLIFGASIYLFSLTAHAAPPSALFFENLNDVTNSNLSVNSIIQDRQGFLWIGTMAGIFRYDGYSFIEYKNKLDNPVNLLGGIYNLFEDSQGRIWAATSNGLAQFNSETNTFNRPAFATAASFSQSTRQVISDAKGGLWLATQGGLTHFNPDSGYSKEFKHDPLRSDSIASDNIKALALDDKGGLWIATWPGGLDYLASGAADFVHYRLDTPAHPEPLLNNVRALQFDHQHRLWIGCEGALVVWQNGTDWLQKKRLSLPSGADRFRVSQVYEDKNATIWVSTLKEGLQRWDNDNGQLVSYTHRAENPYSLPSNDTISAFVDRSNILWVGVNSSEGLSRANLGIHGFEQIIPRDLAMDNPSDSNVVLSIASDTDNRLWFGSLSGLTLLDTVTHQPIKRFHADSNQPNALSNNFITSLYKMPNGPLWIGTPSGLNRLNREDGHFRVVQFDSPASNYVSHIAPGRDGLLWLATAGGLIRYDTRTGEFHRFSHDPENPHSRSINSTYISLEDRAGRVWAAGANNGGGLDILNQTTGRFSHYRHDPANTASLSADQVACIYEDPQGTVWLGTTKGINKAIFKPDGKIEFISFPTSNFANERISDIQSDNNGLLWINTSIGLLKLDPATGTITDFSLRKHFSGIVNSSAFRDKQGLLYFGGGKGILVVDPAVAEITSLLSQLAITDISILNKSLHDSRPTEGVELTGTINAPKALKLSWKNTALSLEFADLHYANPAFNRYAYRMDGFDKDWVSVDAQHRNATYTNLDPGNYVFHVKATHHADEWREISFPVTITPPFWATWWFRLLMVLALTGLAAALYRWRIYQLKRNAIRLENLVTERNLEAMELRDAAIAANHAKSDFIANMSHEIRTPMNSILGMTHLALHTEISDRGRNYLEKIHISGLHLLGIIEEILDFSKISAHEMKLEQVDFELSDVLDSARILFEQRINEKGLTFDLHIDPALPPLLRGDPLRLGQVLINYVSNALKFTEQGNIVVRVNKLDENECGILLRFAVQDDGIGITEDAKSRLFQAFQQADSSTTRLYGGTGLGLSICKQLVELMPEGKIGVESAAGKGSTFWFMARLKKSSSPSLQKTLTDLSANTRLNGMRILVAEDNQFNQEVITDILTLAGALPCIAQNGKEALELLEQQHFDCILMDIQMPVMDGFTTIGLIRANPALAGMPVIAMTANTSQKDQKSYLNAGMDDFISKPFDPEVLYATLAKWLNLPQSPALVSATIAVATTGVIDLSVLSKWIGDDPLKLHDFARNFLQLTRQDMEKIDAALADEDFSALASLAHHISSPARMVGAGGFAELCKALEKHAKAGKDIKQAQEIVSRMHALLDQIEQHINTDLA
jgi:signal transduction histidine kinase/ligand-binding sensor domain-containing protein/DNA-binding response OmpR family regulator